MSATTELGLLRLSYPSAELQLASHAVVTSSSSQDRFGTDSNAPVSAGLISASAWVCRGRGLRLTLDLSLNGHPLDDRLLQHLANSICSADLWEQLHLQPSLAAGTSTHGDNPNEDRGIIAIELAHSDVELSNEAHSRHRLTAGASMGDVQPPKGVHVVRLEAVKLSIEISSFYPRAGKRKREATDRGSRDLHMQSQAFSSGIVDGSMNPEDDQSWLPSGQDEFMLLDGYQEPSSDELDFAGDELLLQSNPSNLPRRIDSGTAFAGDQISKGVTGQYEQEDRHPDRILELVDAALRLTMSDKQKPLKLAFGINVKQDEFTTKLGTAAPSLWSPGYLKAMSERAPFLPTIAHALSNSLQSNARPISLKHNVAKLACDRPQDSDLSEPSAAEHVRRDQDSKSVYESVSIGLWHMLQRELFDPKAARRLKPLTSNTNDINATQLDEKEEMLDQDLENIQPLFNPAVGEEDRFSPQDLSQWALSEDDLLWEYEEDDYDEDDEMDFFGEPRLQNIENEDWPSHNEDLDGDMLLGLDDVLNSDDLLGWDDALYSNDMPRSDHDADLGETLDSDDVLDPDDELGCEPDPLLINQPSYDGMDEGETMLLEDMHKFDANQPVGINMRLAADPEILSDGEVQDG